MSWQTLTVTSPSAIGSLNTLVGTLKIGLDAILDSAKAQAELAKLLAGGANLQFLALEATLDQIIADIEELEAGGLYGIVAHPYAEGIEARYDKFTDTMTLKPSDAIGQVVAAFDDGADRGRPSSAGSLGGIVVVGTAPGISEFADILEALGRFFNMDKLRKLKAQIVKRFEAGGRPTEPALSTGLDFHSIEMKDLFPSYTEMLSRIKNKVQGLKDAVISGSSSLDDVTSFIDAQLAELEDIATMIVNFLDSFVVDLSGTGVYHRNFDKSTNTAESIKAGLQAGHPSSWANEGYTVVLGFFASDSGTTKLAELIGLG